MQLVIEKEKVGNIPCYMIYPIKETGKSAVFYGGAHALTGLLYRSVGQAHDFKHGHPMGKIDFHGNVKAVNAAQTAAGHKRKHGSPP